MDTRAFFDKFSEEYVEQNRYSYIFYRWIIDSIIRQIGKKECTILDIGTGHGEAAVRLAEKFPRCTVKGIDFSPKMIEFARKKAEDMGLENVDFSVSSIEDFPEEEISYAVSCLTFHHIKDKEKIISKIYKMLPERGGKIVIGDWFSPSRKYRNEIEKLRKRYPVGAREFTKSWEEALEEFGKEYMEEHPEEYLICPLELKSMLSSAGFRKHFVINSPLPDFAVVVGEK